MYFKLSVPVKAFMKAKPRVNLNKEAVTSSTAKRILEALDRMPTPVNVSYTGSIG